ncbi:GAP1-N2 domain-containing protein [Geodermatophilus sp. SYSU D00079]
MSARAYPQAVYTSAPRTLEGPGFGVFAHSPDWPAEVGRTRKALGALVGFTPDAGEAFGLVHRGAGRLLYRKVAARADGFGRPGNYLVHLLWDDGDRLGLRELLALRRTGRFIDALDADAVPTAELPPLRVPPAERTVPALTAEDVDALTPCLALLLAALADGAGEVTLPRRAPSGREVADVVAAVLPRALTAGVSLTADPQADDADTAAVTMVLGSAPGAATAGPADTERARSLLAAASKGDLPPDPIGDLRRLDAWLFADDWAEQDAAGLTAEQVACVLESDAAARWLGRDRNTAAALALAAAEPPVARALKASVRRSGAVAGRVRAEVLAALLDEVFDGADGPAETAVTLAGLTQGDLCAALAEEVERGRRIARLDRAAGLLVEQALSLGVPLPLLHLTDDRWELALLASRRRVVGDALEAQWRADGGAFDEEHRALLGHLLVADVRWLARLEPLVPASALPPVLRWAALRLDVAGVEKLATAVATGGSAGHGWALREVVFGSELPPPDVDTVLSRSLALLLVDDGWPAELAESFARSRGAEDDVPRRRRRRD